MSQWIGTRDVKVHSDNAQPAPMPPIMQGLQRPMSQQGQQQRPMAAQPAQPARTARTGFPSTVITRQEADSQRPPRQYAIQGAAPAGRPVWPENIAGGGAATIPVYDGMLDGRPLTRDAGSRIQAEPSAAKATTAPVLIPDPDEYEGDPKDFTFESENTVLAVYGLDPPESVQYMCDVAAGMEDVLARLAALEARLAELEGPNAKTQSGSGELEDKAEEQPEEIDE